MTSVTEPAEVEISLDTPTVVSTTSLKPQVLPLIYVQTQSKAPFTSISKPAIVNTVTVPQIQFATNPTRSNQSVIFTPVKNVVKPQQLVIQKTNSMPKFTRTYLTIKPLSKLSDSTSSTISSPNPGKLMIAPMPKVIKNRIPVTVTTNSLQPKIAFMPLTIPTSNDSKKVFNFKIKEGQITENDDSVTELEIEKMNVDEKPEQEYELSIVDDSNSKCDVFIEKRKKHGISILKKSSILSRNAPSTNPNPVPDTENPMKLQKPERRRKSNFSYRKDYDDIEIIEESNKNIKESLESADVTLTKLEESFVEAKEEKNILDVEMIKEKKAEINGEPDLAKILKWDEGIGSLPGSELKFIINEFNLVEYVTKEEYDKIIEKRIAKVRVKDNFQEDLHCAECGCYGLPSEFITPKYCSLDCQESGINKQLERQETKVKKRRRKNGKKSSTEAKPESGSDEGNTSNENSQDKYAYPWTCSKKGFSWTKYLDHVKAKAAPVKLFKDPFPYNKNGFRSGMKLEGIDQQHPSFFCVLTVAETCGYRLRLHFDGYPSNYDFWTNADSMDIFPIGWCEKHGHPLQPPPGYSNEDFNWVLYLKHTKSTAAPKHLFANRAGNAICPNGFRVGMKLEAVDKKDNTLVCVATVTDMMDNRILVHFDSWDDIYDYWADPMSPYIHPVGWCDQYGHRLTPPNDYPNPETFSWSKYLKETKSVAAPVRAFKQRPACGFKRGMRLECVDKRVPQLIRVATVDDVRVHQIRIHFDGWPDRYSYWIDTDSDNIHPVGWCHKTGHPLEPPLTPDDVYDFLECPTVGCRGKGHIEGSKYDKHSEQKYCPYAEDNIDTERNLPDRLQSPDRPIEAVVPIQREPTREKIKPRLGRPPKIPRVDQPMKTELSEVKTEPDEVKQEPDSVERETEEEKLPKKQKRKYRKRLKVEVDEENAIPEKIAKVESPTEENKIEPAVRESWAKHSQFLYKYLDDTDDNTALWSDDRVEYFVGTIPGLEEHSKQFKSSEIDGEAFLSLSQSDLIDFLHIKVGPAVKLYNIIVLLRQRLKT